MASAYYVLFERPFVRVSKRIAVNGPNRRMPGTRSQLAPPVSPD
jgi:hypothetical protein